MDLQLVACNLNGYLHALRRISNNECDFWADTMTFSGCFKDSLSTYLGDQAVSLGEHSIAGYFEIEDMLERWVLSKLTVKDANLLALFSWDIVEFIQHTFCMIEPEINPISNGKVVLFNAKSDFHGDYVYLVVPVESEALILCLATRT